MTTPWKPEGYPSLSPYLVVDDANEVVRFLEKVFAAKELRRHDRPDGSVMHVEVGFDSNVVMIGKSMTGWPAVPTHLHVYVQDVDALYQKALEAGGEAVQEPQKKEGDEDKRGAFKGPGGNTWWVATQIG